MFSFEWINQPETWIALLTLTLLEIVLGIDNIVFISILCGKLPEKQRPRARTIGLGMAMGMRIVMLLSIGWIMSLEKPLFHIPLPASVVESIEGSHGDHDDGHHVDLDGADGAGHDESGHAAETPVEPDAASEAAAPDAPPGGTPPDLGGEEDADFKGLAISGRDLILLIGGLFLLFKATYEIHDKLEGGHEHSAGSAAAASFAGVITQITLLDIVFSIDSVITAIGMADHITIMILAVVVAVGFMMVSAGAISRFIEKHPTLKMLALCFLMLIGMMLVVEGLHAHVPKGYIYFAMAFSVFVEFLNIRVRSTKKVQPVALRQSYVDTDEVKTDAADLSA